MSALPNRYLQIGELINRRSINFFVITQDNQPKNVNLGAPIYHLSAVKELSLKKKQKCVQSLDVQ